MKYYCILHGRVCVMCYRDVLPGLCGLYNLNSADDLMLRNGTPVGKVDKDKFGNDWVVTGNTYFVIITLLLFLS